MRDLAAEVLGTALDIRREIADTRAPYHRTRNHPETIVANTIQSRKRARQNTRRRLRNMSGRSALRTAIKKFLKLAGGGDREAAAGAYRAAGAAIDRAANKGLHRKNRAARLKRRLNNRLRALG